jgi:hypothetical protein
MGRVARAFAFGKLIKTTTAAIRCSSATTRTIRRFKQQAPEGTTYDFDAFGVHAELFAVRIW